MTEGLLQIGEKALRHAVAVTLLLALTAGCASSPDEEQSIAHSDDGISGTGLVAHSGDGISGTGLVAQLGGDGIGGTGIIGTISGFGSIIVNGLKLEYNNKTMVESDGRPSALVDLKVGQVIEGIAWRDRRGNLRLEKLEIRHAVTGPISSIDYDSESLVVLGQTVRVNLAGDNNQKSEFSSLKVGDMVRVSGLRMDTGLIIASRLDQTDDDGRVLVRGPVTVAENGAASIGDLNIDLSSAALADTLSNGTTAFVAGRMLDEIFTADVAIRKQGMPFSDSVTDIYLEGYVPQNSDGGLAVQGFPIIGLSVPSNIRPGDRVVVTGQLGADGSIAAREIKQVRTVVTLLRPAQLMRPARVRPTTIDRPQRIERARPVERPNSVIPERPQRERPGNFRPPMV